MYLILPNKETSITDTDILQHSFIESGHRRRDALGGMTAVGSRIDDTVPWPHDVMRVDVPLSVVDGGLIIVDTVVVVGRLREGSVAIDDDTLGREILGMSGRRTSAVALCVSTKPSRPS